MCVVSKPASAVKTALKRVLIVLRFLRKTGTKLLVHMLRVGFGVLVV